MSERILFWASLAAALASMVILFYSAYMADGKFPNDPCEMSYMYPVFMADWPELVRSEGECERTRYRVYRYFEGQVSADYEAPKGSPVLFVPGHAGSFKQARSLGSQVGPNVNVYTVDLLEQPAALSGSLLKRQAQFVGEAIYAISQLHGGKPVIIVGHSMGAVAAWGSQHIPSNRLAKISTFFAICAPLLRPILLSEQVMNKFYSDFALKANVSDDTVLVSLSCGRRDALVPSNLCVADALLNDTNRVFQAPVSSIANFSVNHQAVLWCKQVSTRIAEAVTVAASQSNKDAPHRRDAIAKALMANSKAPTKYDDLRDKMIASENPARATNSARLSMSDRIAGTFILALRSNWTRLFAFGITSFSFILALSMRDAQRDEISDAEAFVDATTLALPQKSRWTVYDELKAISLVRQLMFVHELSPVATPAMIALFVGQSLRDEGAPFLNLWMFLAANGMSQALVLFVIALRKVLKRLLPTPTARKLWAALGLAITASCCVTYAIASRDKPEAVSAFDDIVNIGLCCAFLLAYVSSYVLIVWNWMTFGKSDMKSNGLRSETRVVVCIGFMHVLTLCDTLGCVLLVWDALMLGSRPVTESNVIAPPNGRSSPKACRVRLDATEQGLIFTNILMLLPAIAIQIQLAKLGSNAKFGSVIGEWSDFEFERAAPSSRNLASPTAPTKKDANYSTVSKEERKSRMNGALITTEVEVVPFKLPNGKEEFLERLDDVDYDDREPSVLIEVGDDIVQVDTLKASLEADYKADGAETIHIGKDMALNERRRRWTRRFEAQVNVRRRLSLLPWSSFAPAAVGLFFAVQNRELIWIFPATSLLFCVSTFLMQLVNAQGGRQLNVSRVQRGG